MEEFTAQRRRAGDTARIRQLLAGIVRAREAFVDGDLPYLAAILESLEVDALRFVHGIEHPVEGRTCRKCGLWFQWPGELDDHDRFQHSESGEFMKEAA